MEFEGILLICYVVVVVIQILFFVLIFSKLAFYKLPNTKAKDLPISVIVCAKNEYKNLKRLIPIIIDQDYRNFELVLINDSSTDKSLKVMEKAAETYKNVKVVDVKQVEKFYGNKKYALTLGIKAATNNFLLFTDADCVPASKDWIHHVSACFTKQKHIVLGYGAYAKVKGSLLNKMIRFETLISAMHYFSMALKKAPYMGVGRNMAYKKGLFFENNGFIKHLHINSGDDDLFINSVSNPLNTTICINPNAFTVSNPKTSFRDWVIQKRRHITTSNYYKKGQKLILGLFYISQFLFYGIAITLLILNYNPIAVLSLFAFRFLIQMIITSKIASKLNEKDLLIFLPILEMLLIVFHFYIFIVNLISKPKRWN